MVSSKQCTDTFSDSHDATRHKSKRTLAYSFSAISPAIPFAIRYAGFELTRWIARPEGRTPFQCFRSAPYVSPFCVFGQLVFPMIPDHEVRASKLTNRWISGCWCGRDASSDEHLVGTKFGLLKYSNSQKTTLDSNGAVVNRSMHVARSGILMRTKCLRSSDSVLRSQGVHAQAIRIRACWSENGRTLGQISYTRVQNISRCLGKRVDAWRQRRR